MSLSPATVTLGEAAEFFAQIDYQPMLAGIARYVHEGYVLFDVGSNAGFFTERFLAAHAGVHGTALLFEPIPHLSGLAVQLLSTARDVDIWHVNSALGDTDGVLPLFLATNGNIGWNTAVAGMGNHPLMVRVADTARYVRQFRPTVIKIDVEGYESYLLPGILAQITADYRPALLLELGWGVSNPAWERFLAIARRFLAQGYVFRSLAHEPLSMDWLETLTSTTVVLLVPDVP